MSMDSTQSLYYALGELAYAVAMADGKLQKAEQDKFHKLVTEGMARNIDFNFAGIIFEILGKDKLSVDTTYRWAIKEMELNRHHLTPSMKKEFIEILEKVAEAFPPKEESENRVIERFKADIAAL